MLLIIIFFSLFFAVLRAQNDCACNCCLGQGCVPYSIGTIQVPNCTYEACLRQCRCNYPQCLVTPPYGQVISQCQSPALIPYQCDCRCCATGTPNCVPYPVGIATAYRCEVSACSIACNNQYPMQCVSGFAGQTQGTCTGPIITTTTMTTTTYLSWLGNLCLCTVCPSNAACYAPLSLGVASSSQCSSAACTQACQSRVTITGCPSSSSVSQITGTCTNQTAGNIRCQCNCCGATGCFDYDLKINGSCSSCSNVCQQYSPCVNSNFPTSTCTNGGTIAKAFSIFVIFLFVLFSFQ